MVAANSENGVDRTPVPLASHTGASVTTHTASAQWLNQYACNETVTSYNSAQEPKCAGRDTGQEN